MSRDTYTNEENIAEIARSLAEISETLHIIVDAIEGGFKYLVTNLPSHYVVGEDR